MLDVGHDEVMPGSLLAIIKGGKYVIMVQVAYGFGLALKTLNIFGMGATDDFEGYLAMHEFIVREVDFGHSTATEAPQQTIAA